MDRCASPPPGTSAPFRRSRLLDGLPIAPKLTTVCSNSTCGETRQKLAESGPLLIRLGQPLPRSWQHWPRFGRLSPASLQDWPTLVKLGQFWSTSGKLGPRLATFGQVVPNLLKIHFGRAFPTLLKIHPLELDPSQASFGQNWANKCPNWPRLANVRPNFDKLGQLRRQIWPAERASLLGDSAATPQTRKLSHLTLPRPPAWPHAEQRGSARRSWPSAPAAS